MQIVFFWSKANRRWVWISILFVIKDGVMSPNGKAPRVLIGLTAKAACRFESCSLRHMVRIASGCAILSRKQADSESCLVGSTPTLTATKKRPQRVSRCVRFSVRSPSMKECENGYGGSKMQQCDNGSRLAWKASAPQGVGGSSPPCCARPPLAANMGRYPVAGSGPDCKSGA